MAQLEHINLTVADPQGMAEMLGHVFGWTVRWEGAVMNGQGYTMHVGTAQTYLALFSANQGRDAPQVGRAAGFNHIGVVVDDLDATEARVKALGYRPYNHADYEPGRRFYFTESNGVEIEVISYSR